MFRTVAFIFFALALTAFSQQSEQQFLNYENSFALADSDQVAEQIFVGVLEGFAVEGGIKLEDVKSCLVGSEAVITDFIQAVKDFELQTFDGILEGLKAIESSLQVLPNAIAACKATESEAVALAEQLTQLIKEMTHPREFAFHVGKDILVNGVQIFREITTAVQDWNTQNYQDFGFQLGEALYQVFVKLELQAQE